jgi:hypothetical protein
MKALRGCFVSDICEENEVPQSKGILPKIVTIPFYFDLSLGFQ